MNEIGRPTEEELDRMEAFAEEYFVGDRWAIDAMLWDDGDVHLEAFSTLGTSFERGYDEDVKAHRQIIKYERGPKQWVYINKVSYTGARPSKYLTEEVIR